MIDASAIIAVLLSEPERPALISITDGVELVAPASVHWEIGNAPSAAIKRRRIALSQAQLALAAYAGIAIRFVDVDLPSSLELASSHSLYAYDAYLLVCALQLRAPLLTLDAALVRVAHTLGIDMLSVAS